MMKIYFGFRRKSMFEQGFTAVELMFGLVLFVFIIIFGLKIHNMINRDNLIASISDDVNFVYSASTKYLKDNYVDLYDTIHQINYLIINDFSYNGQNYLPRSLNKLNLYNYAPCLYIYKNHYDTLNAYLIIANINSDNSNRINTQIDLNMMNMLININPHNLAQLKYDNNTYSIYDGIHNAPNTANTINTDLISAQVMDNIRKVCNYRDDFLKTLIISAINDELYIPKNINRHPTQQNQQKSYNKVSEELSTVDPLLVKKASENLTDNKLYTNISLDDLYATNNSDLTSLPYCDSNQLDLNLAKNLCRDYAKQNKLFFIDNSAIWVSSILDNNIKYCKSYAKARFVNLSGIKDSDQDMLLNCGFINTSSLSNNKYSLHNYHSINFIDKENHSIQIKSNATIGSNQSKSQLIINNGSLRVDTISPHSQYIKIGTPCSSNELGNIVQQLDRSSVIVSQLQCSLNSLYCDNNAFCYLPLKSTNYTRYFNENQVTASCSKDTVVIEDDLKDIDQSVICPINDDILIDQVHLLATDCKYNSVGGRVCRTLTTVCTYFNLHNQQRYNVAVNALNKLQCSYDKSFYTLNNYHI